VDVYQRINGGAWSYGGRIATEPGTANQALEHYTRNIDGSTGSLSVEYAALAFNSAGVQGFSGFAEGSI
jgi:hypothetical protein